MRFPSFFWPKITDLESALTACRRGAWGAWWAVASMVIVAAVIAVIGVNVLSGEELDLTTQADIGMFVVAGIALAAGIVVIGVLTRKGNRVAAILLLCLMVAEVVYGAASGTGRASVLGLMMAALALNGVRGSFAYHMYRRREAFANDLPPAGDGTPAPSGALDAIEAAARRYESELAPRLTTEPLLADVQADANPSARSVPTSAPRAFGRKGA
jgi:hypothetical protein